MGLICNTFYSAKNTNAKLDNHYLNKAFAQITDLNTDRDLSMLLSGSKTQAESTFVYGQFYGVSNIQVFKGGIFASENDNPIMAISSLHVVEQARKGLEAKFIRNIEKEMLMCKAKEDIAFGDFRAVVKLIDKRVQEHQFTIAETAEGDEICSKYGYNDSKNVKSTPRPTNDKPSDIDEIERIIDGFSNE